MRYVLVSLFHLLPLVPAAHGRLAGTIACLLLISLPYIKVAKLGQQLRDASPQEKEAIARARRRWRWLTFQEIRS